MVLFNEVRCFHRMASKKIGARQFGLESWKSENEEAELEDKSEKFSRNTRM
jgi:hypothetical protein